MPQPAHTRAQRLANAFFPHAEINAYAERLMSRGRSGLEAVRKGMGGLWVGGNAYVTTSEFIFEPNGLNKSLHANPETLRIAIPLQSISAVADRFGVLTRIIDVTANGETFSVRCFGAKAFADEIRRAARLT